jgi:hypothetical protein
VTPSVFCSEVLFDKLLSVIQRRNATNEADFASCGAARNRLRDAGESVSSVLGYTSLYPVLFNARKYIVFDLREQTLRRGPGGEKIGERIRQGKKGSFFVD